jgi:mevalonate kinase
VRLTVTLPSKCFVAGEYLVLDTGRALVLNVEPRFRVHMDTRGSGALVGIHPESPAGRLVRTHSKIFDQVNLAFEDPHQGRGGLGASSAQFIAAYFFKQVLESHDPKLLSNEFAANALRSYRELSAASTGRSPSGADLVAQVTGGLAEIDLNESQGTAKSWPFVGYGFAIVRTGQKLATHEHLGSLNSASFSSLAQSYREIVSAMEKPNADAFGKGLQKYQATLQKIGLLADHSAKLLGALMASQNFVATKACGAMGADVLFLMFQEKNRHAVKELLQKENLEIVASDAEVSEGILIQVVPNREITRGPWTV